MKKSAESNCLKEDGSNYDKNAYEKASNTVDICICRVKNKKLQLLVVKRKYPPFRNCWVIPGGFVDIATRETLEESAIRELKEETHAEGIPIHQLGAYGDPDRDPRMRVITTAYYALMSDENMNKQDIEADDDVKEYKWLNIAPRTTSLGFDHNKIVKDLVKKLRTEILSMPIAFEFLNKSFTWLELQEVYEAILGRKLLTPNFRRKIKYLYNIKESKKVAKVDRGRPPKLLQFKGVKNIFK